MKGSVIISVSLSVISSIEKWSYGGGLKFTFQIILVLACRYGGVSTEMCSYLRITVPIPPL